MSAQGLEIELARLYSDPKHLADFLENPERALEDADLDAFERKALVDLERAGLIMACHSYAAKRQGYSRRRSNPSLLGRFSRILKRIRS